MRAENFLFTLATLLLSFSANQASSLDQCGKFNINQFENKALNTELDEHPWIGRIEHTLKDGAHAFVCVGVLIEARHMLTPAHCVASVSPEAVSLVFGDWDARNNHTEPDCDDKGVCAPPGQRRSVSKISIHPDYRMREHQNDLAVVKLDKNVEFSNYVEPICLPSDGSASNRTDLIVAGYQIPEGRLPDDPVANRRHKMVFEPSNNVNCHEEPSSQIICGKTERDPLTGSALVEATESPRKFYLDGIVVVSFDLVGLYRGCLNIRSHLNWIRQNTSQ
ncbi:hypothetical protein KR032_002204 [Drosophila birchii]|nr:hypothetical protein KR032_002204 [Drosophila birchii]